MDCDVYALVGPSGTGKSHRASMVGHNVGADVIIDDGLVIQDNRILAGISSKSQPTRIGAIKTALFMENKQSKEAVNVLNKLQPQRILILGTSKDMVDKIALRLGLNQINHYLKIEDVASEKEIQNAVNMRTQYSKHVIPAPTVEVRKSLPEILVDPLRVFTRKKSKGKEKQAGSSWLEQSVVRPTFTYYGRLVITRHALMSISSIAAGEIDGVAKVKHIELERVNGGINMEISIMVEYGFKMKKVAKLVQAKVKNQMENMTSLYVNYVHVTISDINIK